MKKMTISLLILSIYCAGNDETHAAQAGGKDYSPLTREEIRTSGLYPADENEARHLDHALFGEFNPEERDDERDEAEEEQIARLAARVWELISHEDLSLQNTAEINPPPHTPPLQAEVRQPVNERIPEQAVPEAGRITQQIILGLSLIHISEPTRPY
eukprot:TRINITY_DN1834_c0_g5_i1.p1 TRINITY_DN1834_c0_g5~~TRINITY_DN1834_c0_g5_i1.p1  ORF type:complete len:157 (+),score=6.90 TRINITY_DN1834_c0_g5_i1:92-562(+)